MEKSKSVRLKRSQESNIHSCEGSKTTTTMLKKRDNLKPLLGIHLPFPFFLIAACVVVVVVVVVVV